MKNFTASLLLCFACMQVLLAQSLERYVISSCGGSYFNGSNVVIDYSAGEVAIATLSSGSNILTQGFQQPFSNSVVFIAQHPDDPVQVELYPNPVYDQINIVLSNAAYQNYTIKVYDVVGQLLMEQEISADFDGQFKVSFNFHKLATGNYFIRITHEKTVIDTRKVIKIDQ